MDRASTRADQDAISPVVENFVSRDLCEKLSCEAPDDKLGGLSLPGLRDATPEPDQHEQDKDDRRDDEHRPPAFTDINDIGELQCAERNLPNTEQLKYQE